jgi:shikimate kinase
VCRTNVALVGFMGAGKSTVGRELAAKLGKTFVETDLLVEEKAGMLVSEVFAQHGEQSFRDLESAVVRDVSRLRDCVIACGGGVVLREENVAALRVSAVMVYLETSPQCVLERLGPRSAVRPLLSGVEREQRVVELMAEREPIYIASADIVVSTDGLRVDQVTRNVEERLAES